MVTYCSRALRSDRLKKSVRSARTKNLKITKSEYNDIFGVFQRSSNHRSRISVPDRFHRSPIDSIDRESIKSRYAFARKNLFFSCTLCALFSPSAPSDARALPQLSTTRATATPQYVTHHITCGLSTSPHARVFRGPRARSPRVEIFRILPTRPSNFFASHSCRSARDLEVRRERYHADDAHHRGSRCAR